jgi:hypothetical protein
MDLFTQPNPLTNLNAQIRAHWEKYRPQMAARLKVAGQYDRAVATAVTLTEEAVLTYRPDRQGNEGQKFWEAWELFRNEWAFLPAEADVPDSDERNPARAPSVATSNTSSPTTATCSTRVSVRVAGW